MNVFARKFTAKPKLTRMQELGLSVAVEPGQWGEGGARQRRLRAEASVEAWLKAGSAEKREAGERLRNCLRAEGFRLIDGWGEPVFEEE